MAFLEFKEIKDTGKTKVYQITSKDYHALGSISWYAPWRRYTFFPKENTLWDNKCLNEVVSFIDKLMEERRNG